MPPNALHVTVATLRPFAAGDDDDDDDDASREAWTAVLDAARADPRWPDAPAQLTFHAPTWRDGCATLTVRDGVGKGRGPCPST